MTDAEWRRTETPTDETLYAVVDTTAGPFAVGGDGYVIARLDGEWVTVVDAGPATRHNTLLDAEATDDRERVWFAGSSGALGYFDVSEGVKYDYSAPMDKTSTWEALTVAGERGREQVRVANGSGEVLAARMDEDGCPVWGSVVEPGAGSTVPAVAFGPDGTAYAVDTSGGAFRETGDDWETRPLVPGSGDEADDSPETGDESSGERGATWQGLGDGEAQVNFHDAVVTDEAVFVAGDDGRLFRYDPVCENWTPLDAAAGTLYGLAESPDGLVAVGEEGAFVRRESGRGWEDENLDVDAVLRAAAFGDVAVVVGEDGALWERERAAADGSVDDEA